jgi:hypothetical protein
MVGFGVGLATATGIGVDFGLASFLPKGQAIADVDTKLKINNVVSIFFIL